MPLPVFLVPFIWAGVAGGTIGVTITLVVQNLAKSSEKKKTEEDSLKNKEPSSDSAENFQDYEVENGLSPPENSRMQPQERVTWSDVAGLDSAKKSLIEATMFTLRHPDLFNGVRRKWKGILLYGPPGTGKTYLAKAVATETNSTFFSISSSDIICKYYGQAEKKVSELFQKARSKSSSVIFIDEADGFFGQRTADEKSFERTLKNEWLAQIDGQRYSNKNIIVLAATNRPWDFDSAFRRRFEKRIYVPLPNEAARLQLLRNLANKVQNTLTGDDLRDLAERTERFSGHDAGILFNTALDCFITTVMEGTHFRQVGDQWTPCSPTHDDAQMLTWMDIPPNQFFEPPVGMTEFEVALRKTKPSVANHELQQYSDFTRDFGEDA